MSTPPRSTLLKAAGLGSVGLLIAFALGPRRHVETAVSAPELPADLDRYLRDSEARFPDLRAGCEKTIAWVDSRTRAKTPVSIVYLHGFSATRQETAPLCEQLATSLGANRFETRLTGHGRSDDALGDASTEDWLRDGLEALAIGRRLGEKVILIGCSTGATLATWLAANGHDQGLLAVILLSPNFGPRHPAARLLTAPWGAQIARLSVGDYRSWQASNPLHERYWTTRYPSRVLVDMQALVDLANDSDLSRLVTPTLVIHSSLDAVIDPARIQARFPSIGASVKQRLVFDDAEDPSHHCLAGDILSPNATAPLAARIMSFLQPLVPARNP